jgi:uncharacterized Ntn-hydrolase superfamily protein
MFFAMALQTEITRLRSIVDQIDNRRKPTTSTKELFAILKAVALSARTIALLLLTNDRLATTDSEYDEPYHTLKQQLLDVANNLENYQTKETIIEATYVSTAEPMTSQDTI